jgi:hypothetical protein
MAQATAPVLDSTARQKNDAADAAGICEAVTRPSMQYIFPQGTNT